MRVPGLIAIACLLTPLAGHASAGQAGYGWQQGAYQVTLESATFGAARGKLRQYPVFVLLDGEQYAEQAAEAARALVATRQLERLLLVSVKVDGKPEQLRLARLRLFTTSVPAADLPERARNEGAATGEVELFGKTLQAELRQLMARAGGDRSCMTLFGHSLAGHAALAIALRDGKAWRGTVAASPSLWWGREALLRDPRLRSGGTKAGHLLLTAGTLEATGDSAGRFKIVENVHAYERLARHRFRSVQTKVFPGEDHQSSVEPALRAGLLLAGRCWRGR